MRTKEIVSDLLEHLPDDVSLEEVARKIRFIADVRAGFDAYEREGGVSAVEAKAMVSSWVRPVTA